MAETIVATVEPVTIAPQAPTEVTDAELEDILGGYAPSCGCTELAC